MGNSFYNDNLNDTEWLGQVVDNNDPDFGGKIRVKVFGKFDNLADDEIPWALPCNITTGGSKTGGGDYDVPKKGSLVYVIFENGDLYHPKWKYQQKISEELKKEIKEDYQNAHSLIYDTEIEGTLKLYFVSKKGLMIEYNDSVFNIRPDKTIFIKSGTDGKIIHVTKDGISLGKEDKSKEPVTMADTAADLLNEFISDLGKIGTISTSSGVTSTISTSPNWNILVNKWKTKWDNFKSKITTTE